MPNKVPIGRIVRAHGMRGEVKFLPYTLNVDLFQRIACLYRREGANFVPLEICSVRKAPGEGLLLLFKDISSRDEAEALKNLELWVDLEDLPPLEEDEFYHYQLLGLKVRLTNNETLGEVIGIMPVGPYDLLEVSPPHGKSFYLPLVDEVVLEINPSKGYILVNLPEGLLEAQQ